MNGLLIREAMEADRQAIHAVETRAFGRNDEADLVERIVANGDEVLELVAVKSGLIVGHILFSRLLVETRNRGASAVALAPLAVDPDHQRQGVGGALIEDGHRLLRLAGETLSVVLGDPAYYRRFGYSHERAAGFDSDYQGAALQALAWGTSAPAAGRLVYAAAFAELA
ncbi:GNAT family N-acetyltransferase [Oryzicola mucosus]|uniref:N-acetyltransferase n=1 Tax=Oryzicola mucosus TaxID=2767425 RepID=A0A8J6PSP7_9HYPH|nr:N-acetyltransferase [Oryzicola mucosus]MBD0413356.1 N-acetyltransferase [Oryzicola mucosus]